MPSATPASEFTAAQALRQRLEAERRALGEKMRAYPTPIAGCDQHFNTLLERQQRVRAQLQHLDALCAAARSPEELVAQLRAADLENLPDEPYPHDTVHTMNAR